MQVFSLQMKGVGEISSSRIFGLASAKQNTGCADERWQKRCWKKE